MYVIYIEAPELLHPIHGASLQTVRVTSAYLGRAGPRGARLNSQFRAATLFGSSQFKLERAPLPCSRLARTSVWARRPVSRQHGDRKGAMGPLGQSMEPILKKLHSRGGDRHHLPFMALCVVSTMYQVVSWTERRASLRITFPE